MFPQNLTTASIQSKMSNKNLKRGVDVPPEYNQIMLKLYHCGNCNMNKNQLVDMRVIFDGITKLKFYPKKAREFFIFIALKKRDKNDFACKECFDLYVTDFLQCSHKMLHHENPSKSLNKPASNVEELKKKVCLYPSIVKTDVVQNPEELKNKRLFCRQIFSDQKFKSFNFNNDLNQSENTVGIFWDIENCRFKSNQSAKKFLDYIKQKFEKRLKVKEFVVAISCNIDKQPSYVKKQLFEMTDGVTLINHNGDDPNAADDILMDEMTDFTRDKKYLPSLTHIVVVSNDGDFCSRLKSLKAQGYLIYNIHSKISSRALRNLAHTAVSFEKILAKC